jgi:hypothetical protein
MRDRPIPGKPPKPRQKPEKSARLAEALRANLARRKAQKRARDDGVHERNEQG